MKRQSLLFLFLLLIPFLAHANEECDCFPHVLEGENAWKNVEEHGVSVFNRFKNGEDATMGALCRECHGTDLTGGTSGVSCSSCHVFHFNTENWKEATVHGVYAFTNGRWKKDSDEGGCKGACHGKDGEPAGATQYEGDYNGGFSEKSCHECHQPFPHPVEWADENETDSDDFHGNYVLDNVSMKLSDAEEIPENNRCRGACHGTDYDGGLSNKTCYECHEAYPHIFNWSRPQMHGVYADTFGVQEQCGVGCHGKEYEGGNTKISCYDCHENFPHEANYNSGHRSMNAEDAYQCASLCHGADLDGGYSGVSCLGCHESQTWPLYNLMESGMIFFNNFSFY